MHQTCANIEKSLFFETTPPPHAHRRTCFNIEFFHPKFFLCCFQRICRANFQFYAKISFCKKLARTSKKKISFFFENSPYFSENCKKQFFFNFFSKFFFFLIFLKIFLKFWIFQNFLKFFKDKTNKNFQILIKIYFYRLSFTSLHSLYYVWFAYIRHRISDFEEKKN